jgi:hypothetical protein
LRIFLSIKNIFLVEVRVSLFHTGIFEGDYFLTEFYLICKVFLVRTLNCYAAP